jgi:citrate synthase
MDFSTFMGFVFWWFVALFACIAIAPICAAHHNKKERDRKLRLMEKYPHMAREIYRSIEEQEAAYRRSMQEFGDGISNAVTPKDRQAQRQLKRGPGILRTGLSIAKRLMK